jgi:hypothetical protein
MARSAGNRTRREEAGRVIRPLVIQGGDRDWLDGRVEVVTMLGKSGADVHWGRLSGNAMIGHVLCSGGIEADAQCRGTRDEWPRSPRDFTMMHEIAFGPCPCPLGDFTVGRVPMEVARGVFGVAITFGVVVILLTLLNERDRRASRLRHTVLDQVALPELRGRVGVQIQCAVFSRRSAVTVDLLVGTPHEVWNVCTHMASRLPPRVRLVVHGALDRGCSRPFALETTTGRLPLTGPARRSLPIDVAPVSQG